MRNWKPLKTLAVMALAGGVCFLAAAPLIAGPVDVAIQVTGTPAFGATVTAKATVTINDGSTLQSYSWSQTGGPTATLSGTTTDTVTATLATRSAYREYLAEILQEPPIPGDEGEFFGGLQNRFQVVGVTPFAIEEAGLVKLTVQVRTSSGTYSKTAAIPTPLPWRPAAGIRNVPVGVPVLLHGKAQASYNWALTPPTGSSAAVADPTTQSPEFTPDAPGSYRVTVTDLATGNPVQIDIVAGLWRGMIAGQDEAGRPRVDTACTGCHAPGTALDQFTPWKASGHAEIFTQNVNNPNGHYGTSCLSCHTVGYDTEAANNGIDDEANWQAFLDSGLLTHGDPNNWTHIIEQFPGIAKKANIQCENCHGPQQTAAHAQGQGARATLASDMCGVCHGEPARHGRFQQWQLSGHANYELAREEGTNGSCAPCHSANGFLKWEQSGFTATSVQVDWTADQVHPQTCQTCHDPHAVGTTSGGPSTNATVRISGNTPMTMAGFVAQNVGRGAICITCHNGRRGLRNDSNFNVADASRAPHVGPQGDVLMGQNFYFVEVGTPSYHARVEDTCVACHMEETPPPPELSYNLGGTNHTFFARRDICSECHATITADDVQVAVEHKMEQLKSAIEEGIRNAMAAQIAQGKKIDIGGKATITNIAQIAHIELTEASGRQAIALTLADGTQVSATSMANVKAVPPVGTAVDLYRLADPALPKAGWNYFMIESDASKGVHNPTLVNRVLDTSLYAVRNIPAPPPPGGGDAGINGGPGNGLGAVACTTPYVYWAEIAAKVPGEAGSLWRTDMVARNLANSQAALRFVLHTDSGNKEATATLAAASQGVFEDIVGLLGAETKGSLEICSSQPLLVVGRIFNQSSNGTFGQFLDGHVANLGLGEGQTATLLGLRQETNKFRTNISVTNGGTTDATVEITLFDNAGTSLLTYPLTVPAGRVVQDLKPFEARAGRPDLGWGFATVKVLSGTNVRTSASVIDMKTNDPTTIPAKR